MAYLRISCPKCHETFGQETRFLSHLTIVHGIDDYLALYLEIYHKNIHLTCCCSQQCQEKLPWSGWKKGFVSKYTRGHNARIDSAYLNPDKQREMAKKRSDGYASGQYSVWNKGLTKETSEKVAAASVTISATLQEGYSSGRFSDWRKSDPEKAKAAAGKMSVTKKEMFADGVLVPWNLGLTKETNSSIMSATKKIKARYEKPDAGRRIKSRELETRINIHSDKFRLVSLLEDYRTRRVDRLKFLCKKCGAEQMKSLAMLEESPVCFSCSPKESRGQLEVYDFIKSLSSDAILSDRFLIAPREIDILVPSTNLAVEYNGLYWHSTANISDKNYHESKRKSVESMGHKFFMIFEDEWRDKRRIVESMLRHRLAMPGEILDARKLRVEELDGKTAEIFFEASHLEGHARCSSCFGLVDSSGRIVAAMSLRRPFHTSRATACVEVARSACLPGVIVRGWVGKLTATSLKKVKSEGRMSLVSYVDARVGNGGSYLSSGWKLETNPKSPRFWWTDFHSRFNRFKYRADKAMGLSQADIATRENVVEIWGCGNYVVRID